MNKSLVKVVVIGKNAKLFVKRFLLNKIKYDNYKEVNRNKIIFRISYEDYLVLKDKSSLFEINILKYYGINKYINFFKTHKTFIISFLISMIFLLLISNICFSITVIHDNKEIRTLLKKELTNYGIDTFRLIPNFNKRRIILEKIKENNKGMLEWLEIERKGSLLIVKVTERKTNPKNEELKVRDIVAKKQGIIKKIIATEGVILKKVNDYVSKGETIITGNIIKDETIKGQVISKGLVYAETWYKVKVEYPLYYEEIKYLNEYKNNLIINVFDKKYSLRKNYTDSYLEKKYTLIKSKIIPLEISIQKQRKTKVTKELLTDEEAIKKATNKATSKIELTLDKDEYIIDKKTLYFDKENSKIIVEIFFRVYENITDYKNIDILKPGDKVIIE